MTSEQEFTDTWVRVYESDGNCSAMASEEPRIDAAVTAYLDSGMTRDALLDLTMTDGSEYKVRVSQITGWHVSTPEGRRVGLEQTKMRQDEEAELKAAVGIWEDD